MEQGQQWKWDKDHLTSPSSIAKNIVPGTGNYIKNEMLGVDDFDNAFTHAKKGNVWGAVKSGLTGVGELGLTVLTGGIGSSVGKAVAKPVIKGAIKKVAGNEAAVQAGKKAESTAFKKANKSFKEEPPAKAEPKEDFVTRYEGKAKEEAKAKENAKAKEDKKVRRDAFVKGAAVASVLGGGGDDKQNDPSKWKASAVI